ncbi:MAG: hypothetical protein M1821_004044 [Bathelium mastoideum]|nr:MAG: hypothetical protein M1821_004044 [Bathelium mastoideum]KAI9691116.1 MAG: hypothetical protein M1822_008736 [Bathelium mastoideum]
MGTHISRVKSVDLDAWTDEQLQNMLRWGNARANKLVTFFAMDIQILTVQGIGRQSSPLGIFHQKLRSKIENFIRTKYDSKRWVMDGGMPDPSTLDIEGDDDVPLNVVKEKAQLERSSSQKATASSQAPRASRQTVPVDLFGDDPVPAAPQRPSTTEPSFSRAPPPPRAEAVRQPPKQNDSLLGLDFLGGSTSSPPARPSSATPATTNSSVPSRPDLKQSILSLYASAPRPQPQQPAQQARVDSFGSSQPPPAQISQQSSAFGGLNDAFSGLTFSATPQASQPPKPSPFAGLTSPPINKTRTPASSSFGGGGNFFNSTPKSPPPAPKPPAAQPIAQPVDDFGDFSSATSPTSRISQSKPTPIPPSTSSPGMDDLFDLNAPAPPPASTKPKSPSKPPDSFTTSPFNLSAPPSSSAPAAQPPKASPQPANPPLPTASSFANMDAWGSNEAWGTPDPAPAPAPAAAPAESSATRSSAVRPAPVTAPSGDAFGGWMAATEAKPAEPKVSADEDFGGWSSAPGGGAGTNANAGAGASATGSKGVGGFGGGTDDLFSNVWE